MIIYTRTYQTFEFNDLQNHLIRTKIFVHEIEKDEHEF